MRFFGGSGSVEADNKTLDLPYSTSGAYAVALPARELTWDLSISGLTTQYKAFYFDFDDGSAGYIQYA